jgi:anhydro-N-acetylmuramic acid kinase
LSGIKILGVMTGTSCDGLDASCIQFDPKNWKKNWKVVGTSSVPYPKSLRKRVLEFQKGKTSGDRFLQALELNRDLGNWYGSVLKKLAKKYSADAIANHGQTVFHNPHIGLTLQLGDPTRIANETGLTVISNFREGDLAAKGQGAPLAPLYHEFLLQKLGVNKRGTAIHNIGGISNLTYFKSEKEIIGFDTGPGNIWIDAAAEIATRGRSKMDMNGRLAKQGRVDHTALFKLMKHPFIRRGIPKSTGRDDFPTSLLLKTTKVKGEALVATATAFTAHSIAASYKKWIQQKRYPLRTVLVCGGGSKNEYLLSILRKLMPGIRVMPIDQLGIDGQQIESQAFAFFGLKTLLGHSLGGPWTNSSRRLGPPGHIVPGKNWSSILRKLS